MAKREDHQIEIIPAGDRAVFSPPAVARYAGVESMAAIREGAVAEMQAFGAAIEARIAQVEADFATRLDQERADAYEAARQELASSIRAAAQAAEASRVVSAQDRAAVEQTRRDMEQVFRTWGANAPIPPDSVMWAAMVADGSMAGWFSRYHAWLRERGFSVI